MARPQAPVLASALVALGLLAGCSGQSDSSSDSTSGGVSSGSAAASSRGAAPTPSRSSSTSAESPSGPVLTEPGTDLALGETATVSWRPRQSVVGTLRISVDSLERTTFARSFRDWRVDARTKTYAPFFVHAHITNVGSSDLAGVPVPLYGESAADQLVEPSVFKETFKPCHDRLLPKPFGAGASTAVCLVYLVPSRGALVGAAFRPTQDVSAIVWRGPAVTLGARPAA
ncbi:hypothetical protein JCM18899A_36330 [Nocardioides sp. AN3]